MHVYIVLSVKGVFMNIGIIVYSGTGNTLVVAEKLKSALAAKGHDVAVDKIVAEGDVGQRNFKLTSKPDPGKYEALVFAAPVMAFSLNPAMKEYFKDMPGIKGKKAACFVTKQLPGNWTGGSGAIKGMSAALKQKGAEVLASGIVHWKDEQKREQETQQAIEAICGVF